MNTAVTILHHAIIVIVTLLWVYHGFTMIAKPLFHALNGNDEPIKKLTFARILLFIFEGMVIFITVQNVRPPVNHIVPPTTAMVNSEVEGESIPPKKEVITLSVTEILKNKMEENQTSNSNSIKRFSILNTSTR